MRLLDDLNFNCTFKYQVTVKQVLFHKMLAISLINILRQKFKRLHTIIRNFVFWTPL